MGLAALAKPYRGEGLEAGLRSSRAGPRFEALKGTERQLQKQ